MIILPPPEEIERIVRAGSDFRGTGALTCPSFEEVQSAIEAGPHAELQIAILGESRFSSATVYTNHALIRERIPFELLTLRFINNLSEREEDGRFSFEGQVREYYDDWHDHNGRIVRGYSTTFYRIFYRPGLTLWSVYDRFGGGQGTEFQD